MVLKQILPEEGDACESDGPCAPDFVTRVVLSSACITDTVAPPVCNSSLSRLDQEVGINHTDTEDISLFEYKLFPFEATAT